MKHPAAAAAAAAAAVRETETMRYFSFEEHGTGRRKFVASTYAEFWRRYRAASWWGGAGYGLV